MKSIPGGVESPATESPPVIRQESYLSNLARKSKVSYAALIGSVLLLGSAIDNVKNFYQSAAFSQRDGRFIRQYTPGQLLRPDVLIPGMIGKRPERFHEGDWYSMRPELAVGNDYLSNAKEQGLLGIALAGMAGIGYAMRRKGNWQDIRVPIAAAAIGLYCLNGALDNSGNAYRASKRLGYGGVEAIYTGIAAANGEPRPSGVEEVDWMFFPRRSVHEAKRQGLNSLIVGGLAFGEWRIRRRKK